MIARIGIPVFMVITFADSRFFATRHSGYINGSEEYVKNKQRIVDELNQTSDKHLIMVKYKDDHKLNEEWVYNGPDLEESKIIWARYMSEDKNHSLKTYFKDRKSWLIQADDAIVRLSEY
jgi:hypothetical protein